MPGLPFQGDENPGYLPFANHSGVLITGRVRSSICTMISLAFRGLGSLTALVVLTATATAQGYPQAGGGQSLCLRLESQLATLDRGTADPARAEQVRRYEEAVSKQQAELDRTLAQSRRIGCEGSGFFIFGGQPAQCGPLNQQIQQMRGNLDKMIVDLQRLQQSTGGADQNGQRRAILAALGQNDCGPQYRIATQTSQPRGIFESLFGSNSVFGTQPADNMPQSGGTYRTICVRTCDGFFWPISFATVPGKFGDDEKVCQRMCPAAEVVMMSHRNPGEEVAQAVAAGGRQYSQLPNAFKYRQQFDSACSCKKPGESWSEALKHLGDQTVERGDIVVNEERAKQLSQPRVDAQGKPIKQELPPRPAKPDPRTAKPAAGGDSPEEAGPAPVPRDPNRPVRAVGPTFIPR